MNRYLGGANWVGRSGGSVTGGLNRKTENRRPGVQTPNPPDHPDTPTLHPLPFTPSSPRSIGPSPDDRTPAPPRARRSLPILPQLRSPSRHRGSPDATNKPKNPLRGGVVRLGPSSPQKVEFHLNMTNHRPLNLHPLLFTPDSRPAGGQGSAFWTASRAGS